MGDRANVCVIGDDPHPVFFYTHWKGSELDKVVAKALERGKSRWGDIAYLRRVIFCEMIGGDTAGDMGFGIRSNPDDNSHPIIVVDDIRKQVGLATEDFPTVTYHSIPYEKFVKNPASLKYHKYNTMGKLRN